MRKYFLNRIECLISLIRGNNTLILKNNTCNNNKMFKKANIFINQSVML